MLIAANQEVGYVQALRGTGFATIPTAVQQGTWDPARPRTRARPWADALPAPVVPGAVLPPPDPCRPLARGPPVERPGDHPHPGGAAGLGGVVAVDGEPGPPSRRAHRSTRIIRSVSVARPG